MKTVGNITPEIFEIHDITCDSNLVYMRDALNYRTYYITFKLKDKEYKKYKDQLHDIIIVKSCSCSCCCTCNNDTQLYLLQGKMKKIKKEGEYITVEFIVCKDNLILTKG